MLLVTRGFDTRGFPFPPIIRNFQGPHVYIYFFQFFFKFIHDKLDNVWQQQAYNLDAKATTKMAMPNSNCCLISVLGFSTSLRNETGRSLIFENEVGRTFFLIGSFWYLLHLIGWLKIASLSISKWGDGIPQIFFWIMKEWWFLFIKLWDFSMVVSYLLNLNLNLYYINPQLSVCLFVCLYVQFFHLLPMDRF